MSPYKTCKQQKRQFKPGIKIKKVFDNNLVATGKSKVTLTLNNPTYVAMCILELSKVLMYEFHCDYIRDTHSSMRKCPWDVYDDFSVDKCLILVIKMKILGFIP